MPRSSRVGVGVPFSGGWRRRRPEESLPGQLSSGAFRFRHLLEDFAAAVFGADANLRHSALRFTIPRPRIVEFQHLRLNSDTFNLIDLPRFRDGDRTLVVLPWRTLEHRNSPARCNPPICPYSDM